MDEPDSWFPQQIMLSMLGLALGSIQFGGQVTKIWPFDFHMHLTSLHGMNCEWYVALAALKLHG